MSNLSKRTLAGAGLAAGGAAAAVAGEEGEETPDTLEQKVDQYTRRRLAMMGMAQRRILQELEQDYERDRVSAAKRGAFWKTAGMVTGAVAGSFIPISGLGTQLRALAGAKLGEAAGGLIGANEQSSQITPSLAK